MSNTPTPTPTPTPSPLPDYVNNNPLPTTSSTGTSLNYAGLPAGFKGNKPKKTGNADGTISASFYDLQLDANVIYQTMPEEERKTIFNGLAKKGFYGNSRPFADADKDRSVLSELLLYSNISGKPYKEAYEELMRNVSNYTGSKKAPSVRVTSDDDLKVVFRKASTDLLGYEVDDVTAQKFARSYRQMEIAEGRKQEAGGVYESAAAPSTVAEKQIRQQFGAEVKAVQAGNFAEVMDARIKQLGA